MSAPAPDPALEPRPRIPPGQHVTSGWPVLHFGQVPDVSREGFRLRVGGEVARPVTLTFDELLALPQVRRRADFHCVTSWSVLDLDWEGVPLAELARLAGLAREARSVRFADGGVYTTSLPLSCLDDVLVAHRCGGRPLDAEHGGPVRAVVPSRYAWKSCKWLASVDFLAEHELGFWELRGYHDGADPWREERLV